MGSFSTAHLALFENKMGSLTINTEFYELDPVVFNMLIWLPPLFFLLCHINRESSYAQWTSHLCEGLGVVQVI